MRTWLATSTLALYLFRSRGGTISTSWMSRNHLQLIWHLLPSDWHLPVFTHKVGPIFRRGFSWPQGDGFSCTQTVASAGYCGVQFRSFKGFCYTQWGLALRDGIWNVLFGFGRIFGNGSGVWCPHRKGRHPGSDGRVPHCRFIAQQNTSEVEHFLLHLEFSSALGGHSASPRQQSVSVALHELTDWKGICHHPCRLKAQIWKWSIWLVNTLFDKQMVVLTGQVIVRISSSWTLKLRSNGKLWNESQTVHTSQSMTKYFIDIC